MNNRRDNWTVGEILSAMTGVEYPEYILRVVGQLQQWMEEYAPSQDAPQGEDPLAALFEGPFEIDSEKFFSQLEWVDEYADLLPNVQKPSGHEDVIVLSAGPTDFEDSLRMAIDYAALFNRKVCSRVWVISDTFIISDVHRYLSHIRALGQQGVAFRFLLVTPWGWTEIPLAAEPTRGNRISWRNAKKGGTPHGDDDLKRDDRLTK
jgi:hypothetical protein